MMFRQILNALRRRRMEARGFFCFLDDGRLRSIDPYRVSRELLNHEQFNMETMYDHVVESREPETTVCVNAVCQVFDIARYDPRTGLGWSDAEILGLMNDFIGYEVGQKKSTVSGPDSLETSAGPSSIASQTPPAEINGWDTDSGLMPAESTPVNQPESPTESRRDLQVH